MAGKNLSKQRYVVVSGSIKFKDYELFEKFVLDSVTCFQYNTLTSNSDLVFIGDRPVQGTDELLKKFCTKHNLKREEIAIRGVS